MTELEFYKKLSEIALNAIDNISIDKDGDGFICREYLEEIFQEINDFQKKLPEVK